MTEVHPSPDGKPQICATKSPSSRNNLAGIHDTTEGEISWPNRLLQEPYFHSAVSRHPAVIHLALLFLEITVIVAKYSHKARRQTQILNTIETPTGTSSQGLRKSLQTDW